MEQLLPDLVMAYFIFFNPNTSLKTAFRSKNNSASNFYSTPIVTPDGTVVVTSLFSEYIYFLDTNGNLIKELSISDLIYSSPTLAPDGTVLISGGSTYLRI